MDTLFKHKSPPFENISPEQRPGAPRTKPEGQKEDLCLLKTDAFWRKVYSYDTAPVVVNSPRTTPPPEFLLFWTTAENSQPKAQPWEKPISL
jgi:hypothetical protein